MSKLFDNSDSDTEPQIRTDNDFAKNYDIWRRKEEINKIKTKYGNETYSDESSSSEEEDEDGTEWTEEVDKEFFKTLACLKKKDPRIYDEKVKFFDNIKDESIEENNKKKKKEKPMTIKDYERQLILERGGQFSDDEDRTKVELSTTYVEEQAKLKEMFKKEAENSDVDDGDETGGMFKARQKTEEELKKEEADFKKWLAGKKETINDNETESELKVLKDYWNDPNLDDSEKFIRNYILNEEYLKNEIDSIPTYEEIIHDSDKDLSEDERTCQEQENFEHKYNFRFEEPDQEFIKRFPRTVENSLRKTNDKRKLKRVEIKERKLKEKEEKKEELKKLQELKRKEIEEKIEKLKEVTGNDTIGFNDNDLDDDFDPDEHDKRMQSLFNDDFYHQEEDDQKPEFPEIDEYLDVENWDKWGDKDNQQIDGDPNGPHCEDDDFNMDCDYDPTTTKSLKNEMIENSKSRKKRRRKSLFAKVVSEPKPVFDPNDKTYEEYLDEYYKLDCEDIIGDLPCRFKYRQVVPNDFGLTIEEILLAKDRELNRWCSLKKAVQHRPDHVEKYDQIAYQKKAQNIGLKRRILPSLFEEDHDKELDKVKIEEEVEDNVKIERSNMKLEENGEVKLEIKENSGKGKKRRKNGEVQADNVEDKEIKEESSGKGKKRRKNGEVQADNVEDKEIKEESSGKGKKRRKNGEVQVDNVEINEETSEKGKKRSKRKNSGTKADNIEVKEIKEESSKKGKKKRKISNKKPKNKSVDVGLSDARLSAYGINPKKFKNKIKYSKT